MNTPVCGTIQRQQEKLDILVCGMCKYGKEQAGYRSTHPITHFHIDFNLKNSKAESDSEEEEEKEVPFQRMPERTLKLSSDSILIPKT